VIYWSVTPVSVAEWRVYYLYADLDIRVQLNRVRKGEKRLHVENEIKNSSIEIEQANYLTAH